MNGIKFHEDSFIENSQMETHGCFVKSNRTSNNVCLDVLPNSIHLFCKSTLQYHIVQTLNFQVFIPKLPTLDHQSNIATLPTQHYFMNYMNMFQATHKMNFLGGCPMFEFFRSGKNSTQKNHITLKTFHQLLQIFPLFFPSFFLSFLKI
jgi:hypothetical protein